MDKYELLYFLNVVVLYTFVILPPLILLYFTNKKLKVKNNYLRQSVLVITFIFSAFCNKFIVKSILQLLDLYPLRYKPCHYA